MNRVRLIAADLDGTLLRGDKTVSPYTADILSRCRAAGIRLAFATARPKRTVEAFCRDIPVDALILLGGAAVYAGGRLLASFGIASGVKDDILSAISRDCPETTLSVEIDDVLYANFDVSVSWNSARVVRTDFADLPDRPADKILVGVSSAADMDRYAKYLPDDLYIELSDGRLGLIMNRAATKWNAIQTLSAHFGIPAADIAAFGDDYNDVGMLRNCGVGIAVANAIDEAKAAADYVCGSNDADGPARWLARNAPGL